MIDRVPAAVSGPAAKLIFIICGEESGDRLGAGLIRALKARCGGSIEFAGIGGEAMMAEGFRSLFPMQQLSIVGFAAVVLRLRSLLRLIRRTADAVIAAEPDVLVIIDSPDFTQRVARRVRAGAPAIPIINYVSPSVWAWRAGRARAMRSYVDHVLALLPFEPEAHGRLGGPPCTYVGHPLVEEIEALRPAPSELLRRETDPPVLLILPGSRRGEIRRLAYRFGRTLELICQRGEPIEPILPTIPAMRQEIERTIIQWPAKPKVISDPEEKMQALRSARAALAASGTVTLELALAAVPMVAAYRVAPWEALLARRLIRVPSVILPNLVLGEQAVPEFLQEHCVPERMAEALLPLLKNSPERGRQLAAFARLDRIMETGTTHPSQRAAMLVLAAAHRDLAATS